MVVVLIIGILIAIALPTFLGARSRAQNCAAQSDFRNTLVVAKTWYTDASVYTGADSTATGLSTIEPSLSYVAVAATGIAVNPVVLSATTWAAARMSASGTCFYIAVIESFWARMQVELLNRQRWNTRVELANAIFEYLEIFHNRKRRHSALGMRTPVEFEMMNPQPVQVA